MVPLLVRSMLAQPAAIPFTVHVPESIVIVPLFVNVIAASSAPMVVVGLAPRGTVQPEEMIMSPWLSLVMMTLLKLAVLQFTVESSALLLSLKVTVPLL